MQRSLLAIMLGLSIALAGCAGGDAQPEEVAPAPEVDFDQETGGIQGLVTDDTLLPLEGAVVGIAETGFQTVTDVQGRFAFSDLTPGDYVVQSVRLGYDATNKRVTVAAGAATDANIVLTAIEIEEVYYLLQNGVGRFGCGFAAKNPPVPGVLGARPALAGCAATYGTPLSSTDQFRVDFDLQGTNVSRVKSLVLESEWQSTQAMSGGFSMYWEIYQEWGAGTLLTETTRSVAAAHGRSPLKAVANNTTFEEGFEDKWKGGTGLPKFCIENGECKMYVRAFPYADTLGSGSPVDFSVYADQPFRHWMSEFYGEFASDDYTALLDA